MSSPPPSPRLVLRQSSLQLAVLLPASSLDLLHGERHQVDRIHLVDVEWVESVVGIPRKNVAVPHCYWVLLAGEVCPCLSLTRARNLPDPKEVLRSPRPHRQRLDPQSPVVELRVRQVLGSD